MKNKELIKILLEQEEDFDIVMKTSDKLIHIESVEIQDFNFVEGTPPFKGGRVKRIELLSKEFIDNRKREKVLKIIHKLDDKLMDTILSLDTINEGNNNESNI